MMSVYKLVEIVGTSEISWDDAARSAIEGAQVSIHDLRIAEVVKMDLKLDSGKLMYRTRLSVSFKYMKAV